jgi:hypothetical protein
MIGKSMFMAKKGASLSSDDIQRIRDTAQVDENRRLHEASKTDTSVGRRDVPTPDALEGYQDWHSIVGDDDLEDNPNT